MDSSVSYRVMGIRTQDRKVEIIYDLPAKFINTVSVYEIFKKEGGNRNPIVT